MRNFISHKILLEMVIYGLDEMYFLRVFPIVRSMGKNYGTDELWPQGSKKGAPCTRSSPDILGSRIQEPPTHLYFFYFFQILDF